MTEMLAALVRAVAQVAAAPVAVSVWLRTPLVGRHRAFQHSTEWLALWPGLPGQYLRRAFLQLVAAGCGPRVVVGTGTTFSSRDVRLDGNAYVGAYCNLGWAHVERDAMLGTGVHVLSGPDTHGIARLDIPIRDQPGTPREVTIGEGAWVGNGAIVMASVGPHAVVAAGAVVTEPIPPYAIAVGVPARVIRDRRTTDQRG